MMVSLFASGLVSLTAFVFLIWVGWAVGRRPASTPGARLAGSTFAAWWYALAASSAVSGIGAVATALGDPPVSLLTGLQFLNVAAICMGLAGLLYYLVFLYSGRSGHFWPLAIAYSLFAAGLVRAMVGWGPVAVVATRYDASVVYADPGSEASVLVLLLVLVGPQLLASLALFLLATRLPHSASRVRLLVVAAAIFAWFGSVFAGEAVGLSGNDAWEVLQLWIPVLVGASVLLVHRPPSWLEKRMPPELPANPPDFMEATKG